MNLRSLANASTQTINKNIPVSWVSASGYTTNAAGHRESVTTVTPLMGNVQALSGDDLRHVDGLNIQGIFRSVYLYGNIQGVVRSDKKGGDILRFPQSPGGGAQDWRVVQVTETWPEWCKVIVCLQA